MPHFLCTIVSLFNILNSLFKAIEDEGGDSENFQINLSTDATTRRSGKAKGNILFSALMVAYKDHAFYVCVCVCIIYFALFIFQGRKWILIWTTHKKNPQFQR